MKKFYSAEVNVQMLISLMKAHGVRKVIASPGATNVTFVASIQQDSYFQIYSVADERSAAYMACGLAAESGEPVAISCTGATASRNYIPGLTEAYYRKLPILAITSSQHTGRIGQLVPQVIDRSVIQKDIAVVSVEIPMINNSEDEWACNLKLNTALLALSHRGGGPVHINLCTNYTNDFSVKELPHYRVIKRININDEFPKINVSKIGIFVGAHAVWSEELTTLVDRFCEIYNGAVICDHTSNYHGKYRVQFNLIAGQSKHFFDSRRIDLLIDMGEMSGAYMDLDPIEVWRVNPDGQIRDTWRKIKYIFDMEEINFFERYTKVKNVFSGTSYYDECKRDYNNILNSMPELPFSNAWIAYNTASNIPQNSILHLGILNTLRCWNFFELPSSVDCYCNTGGFGIDGIVSSLVGASLAETEKLHFCIVGDLAFFYDLNAIANHNIRNNIRILLINNGCGTEFKNYNHFAATLGEDVDPFIAAPGHYGNKSRELVKHFAKNLGFEYLSADNKEDYLSKMYSFLNPNITERPILFEVFTDSINESNALKSINHIIEDIPSSTDKAKKIAKDILGEKNVRTLKKIIKG